MEHLDQRTKMTIMIAIMAAMLFAALNQTIVGTALPRIISELGGMDYYSWVFTIYMLTSSITAILVGKLSDMYGRKPFILLGIGIFIIGSFLNGTSTDIVQLIVYRGLQGFGGGMIMSSAYTVIGDLFAPRERGRWQGLMSAAFGLASVFGPTLGGYMVDHAPWHWVFWVFLPFGIVAFGLIWKLFPKVPRRETAPVDYFGSIFLTVSMVPMLLAFSWAGTKYAWGSIQVFLLFGISLAALAVFLYVEKVAKSPVLPLRLFRSSVFTISNLAGFTMGAGMFGAIMYMPFFVQGVMGTSATLSGYVTMPMTLSLVAGSALGGQLISRTGKYKWLAIGGLVIMTVGMFTMSMMNTETGIPFAIFNMILVGIGLGTAMPVFTLTVQNDVKQELLGVATASSQLFRSLGGTIGVSVMGTVLSHRMMSKMLELSGGMGAGGAETGGAGAVSPEIARNLEALKNPQVLVDPAKLEQIRASLPASMQDVFTQLLAMVKESLSYSLSGVFLTGAIIVIFSVVLTFFLKEVPLRSGKKTRGANESEKSNETGAAPGIRRPQPDNG
jgi:EmrB/QacA subfamily drug resistance transporter